MRERIPATEIDNRIRIDPERPFLALLEHCLRYAVEDYACLYERGWTAGGELHQWPVPPSHRGPRNMNAEDARSACNIWVPESDHLFEAAGVWCGVKTARLAIEKQKHERSRNEDKTRGRTKRQ